MRISFIYKGITCIGNMRSTLDMRNVHIYTMVGTIGKNRY